jgi:hypothetical protein
LRKTANWGKQKERNWEQNILIRAIKLFSGFENIFSRLDNLFSKLGYLFSSLENNFKHRNKTFYY